MSKRVETMCNKYLPLGGFTVRVHPLMYPMILNCNSGTFSQPFEISAANQRTQGGTQPKSCLITSSELTSKVLESQCAK